MKRKRHQLSGFIATRGAGAPKLLVFWGGQAWDYLAWLRATGIAWR